MRMNLAVVWLSTATLIVAPVSAQQSPGPALGSTEPSRLEAGQFATAPQAHQWRASKMIGLDVYGIDGEKIGDVSEILIDHEGHELVVVGVGGFLGIAGREIAVPFKAVEWRYGEPPKASEKRSDQGQTTSSSTPADASARRTVDTTRRGYPDFAVLRTTKDDLKNAPEFKYPRD